MSFQRDLQDGHAGEVVVASWFETKGFTVIHLAGGDERCQLFQRAFGDLLVSKKDSAWAVDVKTDRQYADTGNFAVELISNCHPHRFMPGCFVDTNANWIAYLFEQTGDVFVLDRERLMDWILEPKRLRGYKIIASHAGADSLNVTLCWLVPIRDCDDLIKYKGNVREAS